MLSKLHRLIGHFIASEYDFVTENTTDLFRELNPVDQQLFNFDVMTIQWEPYLHDYVAGVRNHLLRASDKDLENARRHYKRFVEEHVPSGAIRYVSIIWIISFPQAVHVPVDFPWLLRPATLDRYFLIPFLTDQMR